MKITIIHDWLVTYAGTEKVLEQIIQLYPNTDLYSLIVNSIRKLTPYPT